MPINIEIQDSHAKLLTDFYIQRLKVLKGEILEREKESKEINLTIQRLKKGSFSQNDTPAPKFTEVNDFSDYSEKWPWVKKIQYAMEKAGGALTTKEIVDFLSEFEADFIFDRKRAVASISSVLSSKSGLDKEFIKVDSDSGDFAYNINQQSNAIGNTEL